jgi:methionyl-tRNA formyltransferase
LRAFVARGVPVGAVLIDTNGFSTKNLAIWEDRTARRLPPIDLSEFASLQIPFYFLTSHNSPEGVALVNRLGLDLLINGGTTRILKESILNAPRLGVLNIHPGRLPDYRGCTCVEWAVHNDEEVCNSAHFMTKTIDGGPVVLSEGYLFSSTDNYVDLRVKVYRKGFDLLARAADKVLLKGMTATVSMPQDPGGNYYKPISDELLEEVKKKLDAGRYRYQIRQDVVLNEDWN